MVPRRMLSSKEPEKKQESAFSSAMEQVRLHSAHTSQFSQRSIYCQVKGIVRSYEDRYPRFHQLMDSLLEKKPENRPQFTDAVISELDRTLDDLDSSQSTGRWLFGLIGKRPKPE